MTLMQLIGNQLVASRAVFVTLNEGDFSVQGIATRAQESLNSLEPFIVMDGQNRELGETAVTQSKPRKINIVPS
jgi:hypothetical protein